MTKTTHNKLKGFMQAVIEDFPIETNQEKHNFYFHYGWDLAFRARKELKMLFLLDPNTDDTVIAAQFYHKEIGEGRYK